MTRLRTLGEIIPETSPLPHGNLPVRRVVDDSREVREGDVFVAVRGVQFDGHDFIAAAVQNGAAAIVSEVPLAQHSERSVTNVVVKDSAATFARASMKLEMNHRPALTFAGITGTNGKTTTAWLLRSILNAAGHQTGLLGTIEVHDGLLSLIHI